MHAFSFRCLISQQCKSKRCRWPSLKPYAPHFDPWCFVTVCVGEPSWLSLRYVSQTSDWTGSKNPTALNLSVFWEQVTSFVDSQPLHCALCSECIPSALGSLASTFSHQLKCQGCSKAILNSLQDHPGIPGAWPMCVCSKVYIYTVFL